MGDVVEIIFPIPLSKKTGRDMEEKIVDGSVKESKCENIIEIKELGKSFKTQGGEFVALDHINLNIRKGSIQGIIGLSGAGKSTLVRCINYLEKPSSGQIFFQGKSLGLMKEREILAMRQNMGMIFQQFNLLEQRNLVKNVSYPLEIAHKGSLLSYFQKQKERIKRAKDLLALVGLEGRENSYPSQLSGGQKQRVAIARALATKPDILLCDEATSALDPKTTEQILNLLKQINRDMGVTIILITHQMSVIEAICDEVAIIDRSRIAEAGPVKEIFRSPKSEIGRKLILGEGEKEIEFGTGKRIRLVFDGRSAHEPVLSELILSAKAPVNILFANTKEVEGLAMGQMIIELPENPEDELHILSFLKERGILYEEVRS